MAHRFAYLKILFTTAVILFFIPLTACTISPNANCTADEDCADNQRCAHGGGLVVRDGVCVDLDLHSTDVGDDTGDDVETSQPNANNGPGPDANGDQQCQIDEDCGEPRIEEIGECEFPGDTCAEIGEQWVETTPQICTPDQRCEYAPAQATQESTTCTRETDELSCDDGLSCTVIGGCAEGSCHSGDVEADWCLIDEQCVAAGDENPDNPCQSCIPLISQHQWSQEGGCFTAVDAGGFHTCALDLADEIHCWGRDDNDQATPPEGAYSHISAGSFHNCALDLSGQIHCWGENLGDWFPSTEDSFSSISSGGFHSCAIDTDGHIKCWGDNSSDQLESPGGTFLEISAGGQHTCAIDAESRIHCWGSDSDGQLDHPVGTYTTISSGNFHSCAASSFGEIDCWGRDDDEQISSFDSASFFLQVTAGDSHTCAIDDSDQIHCSGSDTFGELAAPSGSFTRISAGRNHTCAIDETQGLHCWGRDSDGQSDPP